MTEILAIVHYFLGSQRKLALSLNHVGIEAL